MSKHKGLAVWNVLLIPARLGSQPLQKTKYYSEANNKQHKPPQQDQNHGTQVTSWNKRWNDAIRSALLQ